MNKLNGLAKKLVLNRLRYLTEGYLELVCPEGNYCFGEAGSSIRGLIVVHDERFFLRVLKDGDIGLGESFVDQDWSSPDLTAVIQIGVKNLAAVGTDNSLLSALARFRNRLWHRQNENSLSGSRKNISCHYDLGNDFYRLFLDPRMAYSCAYFETSGDSLERAQFNKFDRICKKLNLSERDHVLEIGTGWGGFAVHAARNYGCRVTTTTISRAQHDYTQELIEREGLSDRINLLFCDYRQLNGTFDKIVSIEMFEAVGLRYYDTFFQKCEQLLNRTGSMLLQTISINDRVFDSYRKNCDWIQKYIFPGAELASVAEICRSVSRRDSLQIYHAEDIGMHYASTLRAWRDRFLKARESVMALGFDERFVRMWTYYFTYCEAAFLERHIGDFQILLTRSLCSAPLLDEPAILFQNPAKTSSA